MSAWKKFTATTDSFAKKALSGLAAFGLRSYEALQLLL